MEIGRRSFLKAVGIIIGVIIGGIATVKLFIGLMEKTPTHVTTPVSTPTPTTTPTSVPCPIIGINYPWLNYPDFGRLTEPDRQTILSDLDFLKSIGITAVRWYILGDGVRYGTGTDKPFKDPRTGIWHFNPPYLDPNYTKIKDDFVWALSTFQQKGMLILPSLLDYGTYYPGMAVSFNPLLIKRGRADLITDITKRDFFIQNIVKELLDVSVPYKEVIYAWDVHNEPIYISRDQSKTGVSQNQLVDYLYKLVQLVNSYKNPDGSNMFKSSIGWPTAKNMLDWKDYAPEPYFGVTLHHFHYYRGYPKAPPLPLYDSLPHPCIVGEYASQHVENPAKKVYNWTELPSDKQTVYYKLQLLKDYGYPGSFMWAMKNKNQDGPGEWNQITQDSIVLYIKEFC